MLCEKLAASFCGCVVTGLDFAGRPAGLKPEIRWAAGDFFRTLPGICGEMAVGSLILHHFSDAALLSLGKMLGRFRVLAFSEPLRARLSLGLCLLARPLVGRVTRHDMASSIRAGFQKGELAALLGLDRAVWAVSEDSKIRGVLRFKAWRD